MAWRCGSLSRSLLSTARASPIRNSVSRLPHPSPSPLSSHLLQSRRSLFSLPRSVGQLGCSHSLLPLHSAVASARLTSHISSESRAFCELSQGT